MNRWLVIEEAVQEAMGATGPALPPPPRDLVVGWIDASATPDAEELDALLRKTNYQLPSSGRLLLLAEVRQQRRVRVRPKMTVTVEIQELLEPE